MNIIGPLSGCITYDLFAQVAVLQILLVLTVHCKAGYRTSCNVYNKHITFHWYFTSHYTFYVVLCHASGVFYLNKMYLLQQPLKDPGVLFLNSVSKRALDVGVVDFIWLETGCMTL